jgi:hypothetical protein
MTRFATSNFESLKPQPRAQPPSGHWQNVTVRLHVPANIVLHRHPSPCGSPLSRGRGPVLRIGGRGRVRRISEDLLGTATEAQTAPLPLAPVVVEGAGPEGSDSNSSTRGGPAGASRGSSSHLLRANTGKASQSAVRSHGSHGSHDEAYAPSKLPQAVPAPPRQGGSDGRRLSTYVPWIQQGGNSILLFRVLTSGGSTVPTCTEACLRVRFHLSA